jgi:hypothetical protein
MRFLFVYQDYAHEARRLLDELSVSDVQIIVARRGESAPSEDEILILKKHPDAPAAACELNRKYRKAAEKYVNFTVEPKKFRFQDRVLRDWLAPPTAAPVAQVATPSQSFGGLKSGALMLHPNALDRADELAKHRWAFAAKSAALLERFANNDSTLGPMSEWKENHGVAFAPNGAVSYACVFTCGHGDCRTVSPWHLKEGDKTTPEAAARIYFQRVESMVLISYVGPHPDDGQRTQKVEGCLRSLRRVQ